MVIKRREMGRGMVGVRKVTKANQGSSPSSLVVKSSKVISEMRFKSIKTKLYLL